jgi:hypothetical protein
VLLLANLQSLLNVRVLEVRYGQWKNWKINWSTWGICTVNVKTKCSLLYKLVRYIKSFLDSFFCSLLNFKKKKMCFNP